MIKLNIIILFLLAFLVPNSFASNTSNNSKDVVDLSLLDLNVNPCLDFFQYACGTWLKNNPIPADKSDLYRFTEIDENTLLILKNILQNYQRGENSPIQLEYEKLGNAYTACMNTESNNGSSLEIISIFFKQIDSLKNKQNLMPIIADLQSKGINPFFEIYSMQNPGDATKMIGTLDQAGTGLPEKAYYTNAENLKIRNSYKQHIKKSFALAGIPLGQINEYANSAFKVENKISKIILTAIEQQDPLRTYNPIGKMALQKLSPNLDWSAYFETLHYDKLDSLNVVSPKFFKRLSTLIARSPLSELKAYLKWQIINHTSRISTLALQEESFNFYGKILNGKKEREPHWKTCIASVDNTLGEALGESFIKLAFGEDSKKLADNVVAIIKISLEKIITNLDWMDSFTKTGALKKMQTLNQKIGFPKTIKKYDNLNIRTDSWFQNNLASNIFHFNEDIKKTNQLVDRNEWAMTPPTNNAYYDATMNEIVFPAGILQAPFFNIESSLAANYGATGSTIGHEMTHGFDDSGSQYDELGNLKNWWSDKSAKLYKTKSQCLIKQYSSYKTSEGVRLNGELSVGENIADLGGIKTALVAFKQFTSNPKESEIKTFFIAYGQSWCGHLTKEAEQTQIKSDTHSLPKFRVNGVVSNLPEFAEVFQCKEGLPMAPLNRCSVW